MINLYAYTYASATAKYANEILVKIGDSIRDADIRMNEQGGAAEYEAKITVGVWPNLTKIKRDHDVHKALSKYHHQEGKGTEWFRLPVKTIEEAKDFIDKTVTNLEGKKSRPPLVLRKLQQKDKKDVLAILVI